MNVRDEIITDSDIGDIIRYDKDVGVESSTE